MASFKVPSKRRARARQLLNTLSGFIHFSTKAPAPASKPGLSGDPFARSKLAHIVFKLAGFLQMLDALGVTRLHRFDGLRLLVELIGIVFRIVLAAGHLLGIAGLGLPAITGCPTLGAIVGLDASREPDSEAR